MVGHLLIEGFISEPYEIKLLLCFKLNKESVPCDCYGFIFHVCFCVNHCGKRLDAFANNMS